jgi:hypothetical protein
MPKFLNKSYLSFLIMLLCTLFLFIIAIMPLVHKISDSVKLYYPVLESAAPTIYLDDHKLKLEGEIPQTIQLENGVTIFFDAQVNDSLLNNSPAGSVFIAENAVKIKTRSQLREIRYDKIKVDKEPLIIEPLKIKSLIDRLLSAILLITSIVLIVLVFLILYLAAVLSAGIGLMIDAFRNGPNSFTYYLNLAGLVMLAFIFINFLFGIKVFPYLKIVLISYLTCYIAVSYSIISLQNKKL